MGAAAFHLITKCLADIDVTNTCCLEIGSEHEGKGEGSTRYFHNYCERRGMTFYSVDFDPQVTEYAKKLTPNAVCVKGENFLLMTPPDQRVIFAYLDNFDWIYPAIAEKPKLKLQIERYAALDQTVMNNPNSQRAHLSQASLLLPYVATTSFILFDDTWRYENGMYDGKGGTAVPFLLSHGYHVAKEKVAPDGQGDTFDGYVLLARSP